MKTQNRSKGSKNLYMIDVAIVSLPRLDLTRPAIAPAILSSIADRSGLSNKIFDVALDIYENTNKSEWEQIDLYWQLDLNYKLGENLWQKLNSMFDDYVNEIVKYNPKFIAVSVFSHNSKLACDLLLEKLSSKNKNCKVIIGGQGITLRESDDKTYAQKCLDDGLIDFYCIGEAETTFENILIGNQQGPGINNMGWKQLENLDESPMPNYKDYQIQKYHHLSWGPSLWINASRGCVRRCDFCDIGKIWKKFRFRSGESVADEIKKQMVDLEIKGFHFSDALINGSMKQYNDMTKMVYKSVQKNIIIKPKLGGHFIIRPKHQMPAEIFEISAQAGVNLVSVGIETGSDDLRFRMNKKYLNEDIEHHLYHCEKNNIQNQFLIMSGHPTETLDDHQQTLQMFKRFRRYVATGTIVSFEVNNTSIIQDTPLSHWAFENDIVIDGKILRGDEKMWYNPNNPSLTLSERFRRQLEIYEVAMEQGWPLGYIKQKLNQMETLLSSAKQNAYQYY